MSIVKHIHCCTVHKICPTQIALSASSNWKRSLLIVHIKLKRYIWRTLLYIVPYIPPKSINRSAIFANWSNASIQKRTWTQCAWKAWVCTFSPSEKALLAFHHRRSNLFLCTHWSRRRRLAAAAGRVAKSGRGGTGGWFPRASGKRGRFLF